MNLRNDFLIQNGIYLSQKQFDLLKAYGDLVWQKKDDLNLTSVEDLQEIWDRHICDGLFLAALIKKLAGDKTEYSLADYGSGCGYIGLSAKIALGDSCQLNLVETLTKRCKFMDWCIMKLGLSKAKVLNARALAKGGLGSFDFVCERAMGKINEVLPLCCADLKKGGCFIAFRSEEDGWTEDVLKASSCVHDADLTMQYTLFGENKKRHFAVFRKI